MSAFGFDPEEILRRRRPRVVRDGRPPRSKRRRFVWTILGLLLLLVLLGGELLSLRVNFLFFSSVDHTNVFWTPFVTQVVLFLIGFALTGLVVGISVPAWRAAVRNLDERGAKYGLWIGIAIAVLAGIIGGLYFASQWQAFLLWAHHHDFGATDPVFGQDYGFFVFTLPILDAFQAIGWAGALVGLIGAGAIAILAAVASAAPAEVPFPLRSPAGKTPEDAQRIALRHAGIALVFVFIMAALGAHFGVYHLATSSHDNFWGLDATQRNVVRPILGALQFIALGFAALAAFLVIRRWNGDSSTRTAGALVGLVVVWLVVAGGLQLIPGAVYEATTVGPNAQSKQAPSITDFLATSRYAWGLDDGSGQQTSGKDVENRPFPPAPSAGASPPPVSSVTLADLAKDPATVHSARIQDYRQLPDALNQIDRPQTYQSFPTITVDRYPDPANPGSQVEVMLGPREILADSIPSQNFINRSLTYTHGYGVTAVSVNQTSDGGKPYRYVGGYPMAPLSADAPPDLTFNGNPKADPRIYCGLATTQPVVVNTSQFEFDYPKGTSDQAQIHGTGVVGIPVDNAFDKFAVSVTSFGGTDLFLTNAVTSDSRAVIHRTIADRVSTLAPFLTVDGDPYIVADASTDPNDPSAGHFVYIADAYVQTSLFPESFQLGDGSSYKRNAVKAVVDARTCQTTLYMVDPSEPMTATYNDIYPGLMTPLSKMPASLLSHLRYPEDLFQNQANVYASIHVTEANVYFNKSNQWQLAQEIVNGASQTTQAYYVELTLPGDNKPSFVLLQTFSPLAQGGGSANNMTSWLAAESDYTAANGYHPKLISVRLQSNTTVTGPLQFDNNINNNPDLSSKISLLGQHGSQVILGNVIILPFADHSFLYVRPFYVAAAGSGSNSFPQLQYVIVGDSSNVAFAPTFAGALQALFNTQQPIPGLAQSTASPSPGPSPGGTPGPTPAPVATSLTPQEITIVNDLLTHEVAYDQDLAKQDFTAAGNDQTAIKADLDKLRALLGPNVALPTLSASPQATAAPTASPSGSSPSPSG